VNTTPVAPGGGGGRDRRNARRRQDGDFGRLGRNGDGVISRDEWERGRH